MRDARGMCMRVAQIYLREDDTVPSSHCWGHRGASSRFPENTLASFEAAMRDGAEGIESDVHVSADNVVLMFHDPVLDRVTDSQVRHIKDQNWYGDNGMQHVRTKKSPKQAIPTFAQTVELLMRPENQHVKFNIDVKAENDPLRLFALCTRRSPRSRTSDAPRAAHPARAVAPALHRAGEGAAAVLPPVVHREQHVYARKYFWRECDAFSMSFAALTSWDGVPAECKSAGKNLMVWTVNEPDHMMEAVRWEVNAIITDVTQTWLDCAPRCRVSFYIYIRRRLFMDC
ncbi:PLC-like phosphodiesterase [Pholiota molesta]|nr:PLC-like phosphodiesterase [Pholiota molesta]